MWFTDLPTPVYDDVPVVVGERRTTWSLVEMAVLVGLVAVRDATVSNLGFVGAPLPNMLTYATTPALVAAAAQSGCAAVIVPPLLAALVPEHVGLLVTEDPADAFRRIHLALAERTEFYGEDIASRIHPLARIHPTATIGERNARIAADVVVGAGSVITGRVRIEGGAVISPGAVIGASGFQTIRVDGRPIELVHVGGIVIGERALVFSNATVARGLFRQNTVLGSDCRVGNNAFVSHNVQVGPRSVVGHGAQVNGNVQLGADVWIGPGATISNNLTIGEGARVDLGSTVIGNVAPKAHVGGAPAIDHRAVLREVATWRSRARQR
jgi:UDP-3-O-[3-hydroxymyristoyl] glucosamine N-acyltransferase